MAGDLTIFDEPHHHALEIIAARALAGGDAAAAFEFADRRCRIEPAASSDCYVLRAEASYRMGEIAEAIVDLESALEILPEDLTANRRMLAWAQGPRQRAAAIAIVAGERDFSVLRNALAVLRQDGERAFAAVTVLDEAIQGWTTWSGHGTVELTIASPDGSFSVALKPDRRHPLAGRDVHATAINVARPRSRHPQSISLATRTEIFHSTRAPPNETLTEAAPRPDTQAGEQITTVIVPVYDDYAATKACLASLMRALTTGGPVRVLIVDDASPDPRIRRHLASLSRRHPVEVLTNPTNLGFVGAVNRALARAEGDVVLLNSDTIVPPGFLERLAAAVHASSDIGTATPMSNNGEFMSFPIANRINPPVPAKDIDATDRVAADVNRGRIIDVPNGIGFCMYVTRRCLNRTGGLSERYLRGYLEDVDLCLRAREFGFRSVCAADVFVGHAGSRSFRHEKPSLVSRNFRVLEKSFPHYPRECRAFMDADPLRPARAAIERAMPHRPGSDSGPERGSHPGPDVRYRPPPCRPGGNTVRPGRERAAVDRIRSVRRRGSRGTAGIHPAIGSVADRIGRSGRTSGFARRRALRAWRSL
jgi:O-antigen biosynthesis protein